MIWRTPRLTDHETRSAAYRAESKADRQTNEISRLRRQVDRLSLGCQAMWELLRDNTGFTEDQLEAKILEVDERDGRADEKISLQVCDCPACGHKTNSRREICLMCGASLDRKHIFDE